MNDRALEVVSGGGRDFADVAFCAAGPEFEVYSARHVPSRERVALKVLVASGPEGTPLAAHADRFLAEARLLQHGAGPHVARVHAVLDVLLRGAATKAIAREWLPVSLEDVIRRHPEGMAPDDLERYLVAAAKGLSSLHRAGVAMRGLRAEHLLLDEHDELKIGGVGAPGGVGEGTDDTPGHVFFAADISDLAAIFYEAAIGTRRWERLDRSGPLPPVRTLRAEVPERLAAAIDGALAASPDDRAGSAGALLSLLGVTEPDLPPRLPPSMIPLTDGGADEDDAEQERRAGLLRRLSVMEERVRMATGAPELLGTARAADLRRRCEAARRWAARNGEYAKLVALVSDLTQVLEHAEADLRRSIEKVHRHVAAAADQLNSRLERMGPLGPADEMQVWRRLVVSVPEDASAATSLALLELLPGLSDAIEQADRLMPAIAAAAAQRAGAAVSAVDAADLRPGSPVAPLRDELARLIREGADPAQLAGMADALERAALHEAKRRRVTRGLKIAAGAAVVLVAALFAYRLAGTTSPAPAPVASGSVVIDVQPWARVRSLVDARTHAPVPGSEGTITPVVRTMEQGSYEVVLENEQFPEPLTLQFQVRAGETMQVRGSFAGYRVDALLDYVAGVTPPAGPAGTSP